MLREGKKLSDTTPERSEQGQQSLNVVNILTSYGTDILYTNNPDVLQAMAQSFCSENPKRIEAFIIDLKQLVNNETLSKAVRADVMATIGIMLDDTDIQLLIQKCQAFLPAETHNKA